MSNAPELSVVVALISGRTEDLRRCLRSLRDQDGVVRREVLVPFDEGAGIAADVAVLQREYRDATFLAVESSRPVARRGGGVREHHDSLRTVGIAHARGGVIALTEDHAHVSPDWCEGMLAALARFPRSGAVGGAVECDSDDKLNWAVYFCDFGRHQSPLPEGPAEFASDANVAYRREALEAALGDLSSDFHETVVHSAMVRRGWELATTSATRVYQRRGKLSLWASLRERFAWGRSYAAGRCVELTAARRLAYAFGAPLLPFVFAWRGWRLAASRGRAVRFRSVLPLFFFLQCLWALGESVAYLTGRP